jgi:hypothetical protein
LFNNLNYENINKLIKILIYIYIEHIRNLEHDSPRAIAEARRESSNSQKLPAIVLDTCTITTLLKNMYNLNYPLILHEDKE